MKNSLGPEPAGSAVCDNGAPDCRTPDKKPALPPEARLSINRCNLPAVILGSPTYQQQPTPLELDGVAELHGRLFRRLDAIADSGNRAAYFRDYLTVNFRLDHPEDAGLTEGKKARAKATWRRMIHGWSFNADGREGAVLKGWVESRFGLTPRFHGEPLRDPSAPAYRRYLEMRSHGLYGTNALEAQFDLVYAYCQYELRRQHGAGGHLTLYRGVNRVSEFERIDSDDDRRLMLFNSLNSFTCDRDRACEFGDYILTVDVPVTKVFFYCGLLPGVLQGEDEYLVIGGVYGVELATY